MKIRTDFVTNSSSSSFTIYLKIVGKDGKEFVYNSMKSLYDITEMYPDTYFGSNLPRVLSQIKSGNYKGVNDLVCYLLDSIAYDYETYIEKDDSLDDEEEGESATEELKEFREKLKEQKDQYVNLVQQNTASIDDIQKIIVENEYIAWGEFAVMIADNDQTLSDYANQIKNTRGETREQLKKEMLAYIQGPQNYGNEYSFGSGIKDCRYQFSGTDEALEALITRLNSNQGADDYGVEHYEISLETGEYIEYAKYELR